MVGGADFINASSSGTLGRPRRGMLKEKRLVDGLSELRSRLGDDVTLCRCGTSNSAGGVEGRDGTCSSMLDVIDSAVCSGGGEERMKGIA